MPTDGEPAQQLLYCPALYDVVRHGNQANGDRPTFEMRRRALKGESSCMIRWKMRLISIPGQNILDGLGRIERGRQAVIGKHIRRYLSEDVDRGEPAEDATC